MPTLRAKTSVRTWAAVATAITVIGLAGAANAFTDADLVDLQVVDRDTGQALRVWRHQGRLFIAGEPGERYSLRVTNHTGGRVLLVLSVDGVNILTGETAGYGQRGYALYAYQSYDINGWRKSTTEVAAFSFAPLPQSYAARTGRPSDVGVIGMAVFTEKAPPPIPAVLAPAPSPPLVRRDLPAPPPLPIPQAGLIQPRYQGPVAPVSVPAPPAPPAPPLPIPPARVDQPKYQGPVAVPSPTAAMPDRPVVLARRPPDEKLGTAHGELERSVANRVSFERATPYPQSVQQIEYDTWANLVAGGVIPPWAHADRRPQAFPSRPDGRGFVPDPPREP